MIAVNRGVTGRPVSPTWPFGVESVLEFLILTLSHMKILEATAAKALGGGSSSILPTGGLICPNGRRNMDI